MKMGTGKLPWKTWRNAVSNLKPISIPSRSRRHSRGYFSFRWVFGVVCRFGKGSIIYHWGDRYDQVIPFFVIGKENMHFRNKKIWRLKDMPPDSVSIASYVSLQHYETRHLHRTWSQVVNALYSFDVHHERVHQPWMFPACLSPCNFFLSENLRLMMSEFLSYL